MGYFEEGYGSPRRYYELFYARSRGCTSPLVLRKLSSYPHKMMESPHSTNMGKKLLELGFGRGEHLPFVSPDFESYIGLDIHAFQEATSIRQDRFSFLKGDATDLPFEDSSFDRIIATCILAHLVNPERALLEWRRVVKSQGRITIYLPADPGISLRLFRRFISKPWASREGFEGYDLFIARDHINSFQNMKVIIEEMFNGCEVFFRYRPFPKCGWFLNLFAIVEIEVKK
jgi:SAM-dependent methyltransferase